MHAMSFDLHDMLHMLVLLPCLFAVALLLVINRSSAQAIIPCAFFLAIACSALAGLHPTLLPEATSLSLLLRWAESLKPALCFLLIMQLWRGQLPGAVYWLILALPICGGSWLVLFASQTEEVCLLHNYCLQSYQLGYFYQFFSSALIFLLLMVHLGRVPLAAQTRSRYESHRYWLMIALVGTYSVLMLTDLLSLTQRISAHEHELAQSVIQLSLIYLALTSLYRVFDAKSHQEQASASKAIDASLVGKMQQVMQESKAYRTMNLSREQFAKSLDTPEHVISRTINQALKKNFNEYVNGYRIEEAKTRLANETTSITAIAFEVGFSSIASFNRVFKQMVGSSPTEYRQTHS